MGETQGNRVAHWNVWSPRHKYHFQLKAIEDVGGGSSRAQRVGKQLAWGWRREHLVSGGLLGPTVAIERDSSRRCWLPPCLRAWFTL